MPEDIRLATDVSSSVLVTTTILPYGSRDYNIPTSNVTITNLGEDLRAVFNANEITVRVKGSNTRLDELKAEEITGTVDLNGLSAGTHTVMVQITLPNDLSVVGDVEMNITISEMEKEVAEVSKTVSKNN